jgi:hypothetical protein
MRALFGFLVRHEWPPPISPARLLQMCGIVLTKVYCIFRCAVVDSGRAHPYCG